MSDASMGPPSENSLRKNFENGLNLHLLDDSHNSSSVPEYMSEAKEYLWQETDKDPLSKENAFKNQGAPRLDLDVEEACYSEIQKLLLAVSNDHSNQSQIMETKSTGGLKNGLTSQGDEEWKEKEATEKDVHLDIRKMATRCKNFQHKYFDLLIELKKSLNGNLQEMNSPWERVKAF